MIDFVSSLTETSIKAGIVIIFVLISRGLISNLPKKFSYLLWSIVGLRLLIPRGFSWKYGLFNLITVEKEILNNQANTPITYPIPNGNEESFDLDELIVTVWFLGFALMLLYGFISYIRIVIKMNRAMILQKNVFESEDISSPFALGLIHPKIYLPLGLNTVQQSCIIAHEEYHIKRFDHWVKVLSFILLSLHWFNPLCWVAFRKMTLDMEMSCDEGVLRNSADENIKKLYSLTLLSMASGRKNFAPSPISFDGGIAKKRIKRVLKYKKPNKTAVVLCYCFCLCALIFCFGEGDMDVTYISSNLYSISENSLKGEAYENRYQQKSDFYTPVWNTSYNSSQTNTQPSYNAKPNYYFNRPIDYFSVPNTNNYFFN